MMTQYIVMSMIQDAIAERAHPGQGSVDLGWRGLSVQTTFGLYDNFHMRWTTGDGYDKINTSPPS